MQMSLINMTTKIQCHFDLIQHPTPFLCLYYITLLSIVIEKQGITEDTGQVVCPSCPWVVYQWLLFRDSVSCTLKWTRAPHISAIFFFLLLLFRILEGSGQCHLTEVNKVLVLRGRLPSRCDKSWESHSLWNWTHLEARPWVICPACLPSWVSSPWLYLLLAVSMTVGFIMVA